MNRCNASTMNEMIFGVCARVCQCERSISTKPRHHFLWQERSVRSCVLRSPTISDSVIRLLRKRTNQRDANYMRQCGFKWIRSKDLFHFRIAGKSGLTANDGNRGQSMIHRSPGRCASAKWNERARLKHISFGRSANIQNVCDENTPNGNRRHMCTYLLVDNTMDEATSLVFSNVRVQLCLSGLLVSFYTCDVAQLSAALLWHIICMGKAAISNCFVLIYSGNIFCGQFIWEYFCVVLCDPLIIKMHREQAAISHTAQCIIQARSIVCRTLCE